jgi:PTS system N-acetylglucosamine-specific IIC component
MMKQMQRLGKSLMLPVACLPVAAIMMGVGYWLDPDGWGSNMVVAAFLINAGGAIVKNMPILFCIGVAIGMSDDGEGTSALAGLISWLMTQTLLVTDSMAMFLGIEGDAVNKAFEKDKINNVFIGILCGLIGAFCYNKFKKTKLPDALSFFSGKRCVAIITAGLTLIYVLIMAFVWPFAYSGLVSFGMAISSIGPIGAGLYTFFNRLLIPFGLHHALNAVFWTDAVGIADIGKFWGSVSGGTKGVTGMYMTGFFPFMMFGLPAAALAMYQTAKDNKKKVAAGLLLAGALSAFLTGVTEPLEFSFMFLAPVLYLIHAILAGISAVVMGYLPVRSGFNFSGGFIDWVLSFKAPMAVNPWIVPIVGVCFAVVYYAVFRFAITKFDLKTPGREDDDDLEQEKGVTLASSDFAGIAAVILEGLGGKGNITGLDNCITRLRVEVKDYTAVNEKKIKSAGVAGVIRPSKTSVQVVVGTKVQFVADEMKKMVSL